MTPPRRRIAIAIATLSLAGLTTACGAIGNAVDCNAVATDVNKITQEFTASMSSAATDPKAIEKASQETAGKLKTLASKYDGDLAGALNDLASVFEGIKVDEKNPASATESLSKLPAVQAKITSACG
ncbi:hypothetical protein [Nonomuraea sp. NEAU-A123]|jgi:hypothetical protein|uniref:hypothetical protein n=1 Tax=Nonomuraea sp. NEAU-A123 TaxID=2839649 RepID=UPI001BE4B7B2|nr:hypothetical protein [Nonomuraea sp. NEAU-A123]MBT2228318.1 hypothetical protein [Nonomuraea sp. NEAU-A123]